VKICIQEIKNFKSAKLQFVRDFFSYGATFRNQIRLFVSMSTTRKIALGIGLASGALLAAWLLTGDRKQKTKQFITKNAGNLKKVLKTEKGPFDDSDVHYV